MKALDGTVYSWLKELLLCFSEGRMDTFDALCAKYQAQMHAQPALVASSTRLVQKIRVMCLVALVSACAPSSPVCVTEQRGTVAAWCPRWNMQP